jgi:hypothetical protein
MTAADVDLDALLARADADEYEEFGSGTIRALVQRVKDAEAETRRVIEHVEGADELADEAVAERDALLAALAALADTADQEATDDLGNLNDSPRVVPLGLVPTRRIRDLIRDHGGTT